MPASATTKKKAPTRVARPDRQSREAYIRGQLRQIHADIDEARDNKSWQAVAALRRQAKSLREELDALLDSKAATEGRVKLSGATEAELLAQLRQSAEALPDRFLNVYVRAYLDRHGLGAPLLRVPDDGET